MEKGKYPIIANGELYVEPISKKMNFPPKEWPHDYNDAKINICNDLNEKSNPPAMLGRME